MDFLLRYDEQKAKDGENNSYLDNLFSEDDFLSSAMPPKAYQQLQDAKLKQLGEDSDFNVFDAQIKVYKLQLIDAFKQRYEKSEKDESVKTAKIASLYDLANSVKLPSRLVG